jgi:hypothetical protein
VRRFTIAALVGVPLVLLIAWIASNTYWADTKMPMPPKGEARTNPFYAVQRFAETLGAGTTWDRALVIPPTDSVIVLSAWHWNLVDSRREALEEWVQSGGRLVVDQTLVGGEDEFERWSGIVREYREVDEAMEFEEKEPPEPCRRFREDHGGRESGSDANTYWMCDFDSFSFLRSNANAEWSLRDGSEIQAMRVPVGRGTVTVINASPFRHRSLFDGDHGWLFVAATQMQRGDDIHFLSEDDHPSLLALMWRHGAPAVTLTLVLVALVLWRGGIRFGPLVAAPDRARRSLAEQIRGTAWVALRYGRGESLYTATVRALDEAARRRLANYAQLTADGRAAAVARSAGVDADALEAALDLTLPRRSHELRNTIALVEGARRRILDHSGVSHGTR